MTLYQIIRAATSKKRTPPHTLVEMVAQMDWEAARDYQEECGTDDWNTAIDTGFWVK